MAKILKVDLDAGSCVYEDLAPDQAQLGGRAFTSWAVQQWVPPTADPLGSENVLAMAGGILAGTAVPNSGRFSVGCKSPLTGGIKEANSGGAAARKLARLGIRGIVFTGRAVQPTMLEVDKDGARLTACADLWGKGTEAVFAELRAAKGDDIGIVCIGPAGEQMLKASAVIVSTPDFYPRTASRGGVGAVMGSKNLKAVVINDKGTPQVELADPELMKAAAKELSEGIQANPAMGALAALGSAFLLNVANGIGCLATKNFSAGHFDDGDKISGETMAGLMAQRPNSQPAHRCMVGCVVNCSQVYTDADGKYLTSGFEYETLGLLGSNCMINDIDALARLNAICEELGLDTMEVGAALGVAMEGGKLAWGDAAAAEGLLLGSVAGDEMGRLIGNGAAATGKALDVARVPVVKGQGIAAWEPRFLKGTGVTYCTTPQGADHTNGNAIPTPSNPDYNPTVPEGQWQLSQFLQAYNAAVDTLGFCLFPSLALLDAPQLFDRLADAVEAVTGQAVEHENYLVNLGMGVLMGEVAYNRAAGFTRDDDRLPAFMYREPLPPSGLVFDVPDEDVDKVFA